MILYIYIYILVQSERLNCADASMITCEGSYQGTPYLRYLRYQLRDLRGRKR